jgi:transposase-like protein
LKFFFKVWCKIPIKFKRLLVRVILIGRVWKQVRVPSGIAMAGSLLETRYFCFKIRSRFMSQKYICSQCGHVSGSQTAIKGSLGVEIILWLCFLVPGIIYSVWRSSSRHKVCPSCKSTNLVSIDSPVGKKMMKDYDISIDQETLAFSKIPRSMGEKLVRVFLYVILGIVIIGIITSFF